MAGIFEPTDPRKRQRRAIDAAQRQPSSDARNYNAEASSGGGYSSPWRIPSGSAESLANAQRAAANLANSVNPNATPAHQNSAPKAQSVPSNSHTQVPNLRSQPSQRPPFQSQMQTTANHVQANTIVHQNQQVSTTIAGEPLTPWSNCKAPESLIHLANILEFLRVHRPEMCNHFSNRCIELYNREFSRKKRLEREAQRGHAGAPGTPGRPSTPAPLRPSAAPPVYSVGQQPFGLPSQKATQKSTAAALPAQPQIQSERLVPPPGPASATVANGALGGDGFLPPPAGQMGQQSFQANQPIEAYDLSSSHYREDKYKTEEIPYQRRDLRLGSAAPVAANSDPRPSIAKHSNHPFLMMRSSLWREAKTRYEEVISNRWKGVVPVSNDNSTYELWREGTRLLGPSALVSRSIVNMFPALHDARQNLAATHAEVLRFMWVSLVISPCTGAVLSGGMGLARISQTLVFSAMYFSRPNVKRSDRLLVVIPSHAEDEWANAVRSYPSNLELHFLPNPAPGSLVRILNKWERVGGILVCSETDYYHALTIRNKEEQGIVTRLFGNPGPTIVVLDEASRLSSLRPAVRRMLNRAQTKARLALTSVSPGGSTEGMWNIVDWTSPRLLGDFAEFRSTYLQRIARGHGYSSTITDGQTAFRAAAHLWQRVNPLVFHALGSFEVDRLRKRQVQVDSVTLYTNLIGSQIEMYKTCARFLSKKVSRGDISAFVAAHVLKVAATSPQALQLLLTQGALPKPKCEASNRLSVPLAQVAKIFRELANILESKLPRNRFPRSSPKLHVAVNLYRNCVRSREKLVIFTNSAEIQKVLHDLIMHHNIEGGNIFNYNLEDSASSRQKVILRFKEERSGVLVAPYGATKECWETAGWGDLDVERVLIMDVAWQCNAEQQCLQRVRDTIPLNRRHFVQVIHLVSAGTIEKVMYNNFNGFFDRERIRLNGQIESATPNHETNEERGYLICPSISSDWIIDRDYPHQTNASQPARVDSNDPSTRRFLENDRNSGEHVLQLLELKMEGNRFAVAELSAKRNRCVAVANALELSCRIPIKEHDRVLAEQEYIIASTEHFKKSDFVMREVERSVDNNMGITPQDPQDLDRLMSANGVMRPRPSETEAYSSSSCTLATCWEPYYNLFDRNFSDYEQQNKEQGLSEPQTGVEGIHEVNGRNRSRDEARNNINSRQSPGLSRLEDPYSRYPQNLSLSRDPQRGRPDLERSHRGPVSVGHGQRSTSRGEPPNLRPPVPGRGRGRQLTTPAWATKGNGS